MATFITTEFLNRYLSTNTYEYPSRDAAVKLYTSLRVHFDGEFPADLISKRRPNESPFSLQYREQTYKPKSKIICSRVSNSLGKIRRSPDWNIKFPSDRPSTIPPELTLERYINYDFPIFKSLTMWLFSVCLKNYLMDSNGVCAVVPRNPQEALDNPATYIEPFPYIYNSDQIIDFKHGEYCVLESPDKCSYKVGDHTFTDGRVIIVLTDVQFARYEQVKPEKEKDFMKLVKYYRHDIGKLPAVKLRGQYKCIDNGELLWESRISGMLPELDDFVTKQSDLDMQIAQHVYPEKWTWAPNDDCGTCGGVGEIELQTGVETCPDCKGKKKIKQGPNVITRIRPSNAGLNEQPAPLPPFGYLEKKDVAEMTELLNKLLQECKHAALSAVNMEFLSDVPLAESGIAKTVDRDEANNTVHGICEDIVSIADEIAFFCNEYRYNKIITDPKTRAAWLPSIAVPETYDLVNTPILLAEMKSAIDSGMCQSYISKMQVEIASKKYPNDPNFAKFMQCCFALDPYSSVKDDDKIARLQNDGICDDDYILSCNVDLFVAQACEKDKKFIEKPLSEQRTIMQSYIDGVKKKNEAASKLENAIPTPGGPGIPPANPEGGNE